MVSNSNYYIIIHHSPPLQKFINMHSEQSEGNDIYLLKRSIIKAIVIWTAELYILDSEYWMRTRNGFKKKDTF